MKISSPQRRAHRDPGMPVSPARPKYTWPVCANCGKREDEHGPGEFTVKCDDGREFTALLCWSCQRNPVEVRTLCCDQCQRSGHQRIREMAADLEEARER